MRKLIIFGVIVLLLLMSNPYGRKAVLWLLPMGSGIDDFVQLILLLAAGFLLGQGSLRRVRNSKWWRDKSLRSRTQMIFIFIMLLGLGAIGLILLGFGMFSHTQWK